MLHTLLVENYCPIFPYSPFKTDAVHEFKSNWPLSTNRLEIAHFMIHYIFCMICYNLSYFLLLREKIGWCIFQWIFFLQGDKKSTQQVDYGKTTPSFSKKSYWLPLGMEGNWDFGNKYHFFPSICAQWAMKFFKIQNLKLTSLDNKSKQKPLAWLNHLRITIKSCGQQVFSIL